MRFVLLLALCGCDLKLSQRWNTPMGRIERPPENAAGRRRRW